MPSQKISIASFGAFPSTSKRAYTTLRLSVVTIKNGRVPSHMVSQKLSVGSFGGKLYFLSPVGVRCDSTTFYCKPQKTTECRATSRSRSSRSVLSVASLMLCLLQASLHNSTTFYCKTQKRPSAEPQGVPEALDRFFR